MYYVWICICLPVDYPIAWTPWPNLMKVDRELGSSKTSGSEKSHEYV